MSETETKICQSCKNEFVIEPDDFTFYEKIQVPAPTFCPECRLIRRLAWRNERTLYKRKCQRCGKSTISIFSPDKNLTVYCRECWWSDEWDGLENGQEFDPEKPFLLQIYELFQKVPTMALHGLHTTLINSEYTNMASYLKNCYLITHSDYNENCAYGSYVTRSRDSIDNLMIDKCELCYENVNCRNCYQTFFSLDCDDCHNVYFSKNCNGCSNCFGCTNLRNKSYHIFNQPYSKNTYEKKVQDYLPTTFQKQKEMSGKAYSRWLQYPTKYIHERHNTNVTGDYIYNCKNTRDSFIVTDAEDSRYCASITPSGLKDSYDLTHYGRLSELVYESFQVGDHVSRIRFSWWAVTNNSDIEYSMFVTGCQNLFGCVGLKRRQYCILNTQYSKEEFERLRARIIDQMNTMYYRDQQGREYRYGEFFPVEMSPFAYNETTAHELFPLTRDEVVKRGWRWKNLETRNYQITLNNIQIPDHIRDVPDSIVKEIIECVHALGSPSTGSGQIGKPICNEQCTTAFKIIEPELQFYRKMSVPLPRLCPNCRHYERLKQRNPLKLWHRKCMCSGATSDVRHLVSNIYQNAVEHFHGKEHCPNEFETSYAPERSEIVYCEQCYQQEVV